MLPMWAGNHVMCGDVRLSPPVSWKKMVLITVAAFLETRADEMVLIAVLESE